MTEKEDKLTKLRLIITENLRIQRGGPKSVPYVDISNALVDMSARQNHVVFGRRGCGKTLLLENSAKRLDASARCVYLNCEDFKKHSFPNVLIQILDALFSELENHLSGWFGRKKKSKELIRGIRAQLNSLRSTADKQQKDVRETESTELERVAKAGVTAKKYQISASLEGQLSKTSRTATEQSYRIYDDKIRELDMWLPELKRQVREFFELSNTVETIFLQVDDFYHLNRLDQPYTMDYIHRLCKDLPIYFKIATLRHASVRELSG